jgi:ABC-type branched-subunit amino acid transport system substrate-binding protein
MSKFIKIIFFVILNFSLLLSFSAKASEKIKIGLMVPLTGENKELGRSIIKAVRLAVKDINNSSIEIIPKDTASKASKALKSAFELKQMGVKRLLLVLFFMKA